VTWRPNGSISSGTGAACANPTGCINGLFMGSISAH
jgi:hypothetical protein